MTPREKAERLHKKVNTFFLTCVGSDGYPLTKAVVPGKHRESLKELYFCTNTSSKFASEKGRDSLICPKIFKASYKKTTA